MMRQLNYNEMELVSGGEFSSSEDCGEGEDDDFKDPNIPSREEQRRIDELLEEQRESRNERFLKREKYLLCDQDLRNK